MNQQNQINYTNTDERYGNPELVTITDYLELNPNGIFETYSDGIYELIEDAWVKVAECNANTKE